MELMGYSIYDKNLEDLNLEIKKLDKFIVNTINPHSYIIAKNDKLFKEALNNSDVLLPDGSGIVIAARILKGKKIKKIAGADLHEFLLKKANEEKLKVFYLGSTNKTLTKIRNKIKSLYPNIEVATYSPPFKEEFSKEDNYKIYEIINKFEPDILFIGMTAPKQEKWLYKNKEFLNFHIGSCIGAVFDFFAGNVKRPPKFIIDMHLEWFFRFLQEPRRLWKRNLISTPLFILDTLKYSKYYRLRI